MKKILSERGLAFFLVFVAFLVSGFLYQKGKIKFLPSKNKNVTLQNIEVEIPFTEKKYQLSYDLLPANPVFEVALFESNERWTGDGEFDYSSFHLGKSSLFLSSQNNSKSEARLKLSKGFNFQDFSFYKLFLNPKTDVGNIEEFGLSFISANGRKFKYRIGNLNDGWNLLVLEKEKFTVSAAETESTGENNDVNEVVIELASRPQTAASVNLDFLWAEKNNQYLDEWNFTNSQHISLGKIGSLPATLFFGSGTATLKKISSAKDYTFKARFKPLTSGQFGFFLRGNQNTGHGYYFAIGGIETSSWQISKQGIFNEKNESTVLIKGDITNLKIEKEKTYYLKSELKGSNLVFLFSLDDKEYGQIAEIQEASYASGGVGIFSRGSTFLVDDLLFLQ